MQYSVASRTGDRPPRNVIGTLAIVLGAIVATLGISAGTVAGVEPVRQ